MDELVPNSAGQVRLMDPRFAPTRHLAVELDGGEGMLFKFNTGDAFIVTEPSSAALLLIVTGGGLLLRRRKKGERAPELRRGEAH